MEEQRLVVGKKDVAAEGELELLHIVPQMNVVWVGLQTRI